MFREADGETLTTTGIAEEFPYHRRTILDHLRNLEDDNRVVVDTPGRPIHWRLADTEPDDPVYHPKIARAKCLGNQASNLGRVCSLAGIAALGAAGFVMSYSTFSRGIGIPIPIIGDVETAILAMWVGVLGSVPFVLAFIAQAVAIVLPWYVERQLDENLPDNV